LPHFYWTSYQKGWTHDSHQTSILNRLQIAEEHADATEEFLTTENWFDLGRAFWFWEIAFLFWNAILVSEFQNCSEHLCKHNCHLHQTVNTDNKLNNVFLSSETAKQMLIFTPGDKNILKKSTICLLVYTRVAFSLTHEKATHYSY